MKISKLISKFQPLQEELNVFIVDQDNTQYPLHSIFSPRDEYIEFYSDEDSSNLEAITVKQVLLDITEYGDFDKSITVNLVLGNEYDTDDTIDNDLTNIVIEENKVLLKYT